MPLEENNNQKQSIIISNSNKRKYITISIIFGLLFASLSNLIVFPAFYVSLCRRE